jgi:hypothetical protein
MVSWSEHGLTKHGNAAHFADDSSCMSWPPVQVCARLLRCIAPTADPTAAGSLAKDLPSLAAGTRGLDVDALEGSAAGSRGAAGEEGAAAGRKKRGAEEMEGDEAAADSLMEGKVGVGRGHTRNTSHNAAR